MWEEMRGPLLLAVIILAPMWALLLPALVEAVATLAELRRTARRAPRREKPRPSFSEEQIQQAREAMLLQAREAMPVETRRMAARRRRRDPGSEI